MATGNVDDAHDIVQDAMYKLVQRYARKEQREWAPLFHSILQSRIRDYYRRKAVRSRFQAWFKTGDERDVDPIQHVADESSNEPVQQLESEEFGERLEQCIGSLPYRQQQAFLLRAWEGMNVKQTASVMNISQGSVKTHYSRALKYLRENLEGFEL